MQTENDTSKPKDSPQQETGEGCPGASCSRYATVTYRIVDEEEWKKTNPLKYEHNGLSAVTVSLGDAHEKLDAAENLLMRCDEYLDLEEREFQLGRDIKAFLNGENDQAMATNPAPETTDKI